MFESHIWIPHENITDWYCLSCLFSYCLSEGNIPRDSTLVTRDELSIPFELYISMSFLSALGIATLITQPTIYRAIGCFLMYNVYFAVATDCQFDPVFKARDEAASQNY